MVLRFDLQQYTSGLISELKQLAWRDIQRFCQFEKNIKRNAHLSQFNGTDICPDTKSATGWVITATSKETHYGDIASAYAEV